MSKLIITACLSFLIFSQQNFSQQKKEEKKKESKPDVVKEQTETEQTIPDTVKIGVYLFSLYDLDFPGNKVNADFYVWYNTTKDSMNLPQNFELVNATQFNKAGSTDEMRGNIIYQTLRINSQLKKQWDVMDFPFDKQTIQIIIEDIEKDNTKLRFVADTIGSKIDKSVQLEGWKINDYKIKVIDHTYETSYGDPNLSLTDYSTYSRVVVEFTIEREGKGIFFKLFIGLFISVLIAMLTFFISPTDLDPRFGLPIGAIFASIASQYVISSTLPQNSTLTLVDILHDVSFIYIFLCLLLSTISLSQMKKEKGEVSQKLDRYSFFILAFSYVIIVGFFVLKTVN